MIYYSFEQAADQPLPLPLPLRSHLALATTWDKLRMAHSLSWLFML
jgi:hypothetical protein